MKTLSAPLPHGKTQTDMPEFKFRAALISVLVFSFFVNLLMLTGPLFMLQVYDRVLSSRSQETLTALFLLVLGLFICMALLDFSRGRVMARLGNRLRQKLDPPVFLAAMAQARRHPGETTSASALRDVDAIQVFLASPVFLAVMDLPWTPFFLIAIFAFHPYLGWLAIAGSALLVTLTLVNRFLTAQNLRCGQAQGEKAHRFVQQAIENNRLIISQGMLGNISERLARMREQATVKITPAADWLGGMSALGKTLRLFLQSAMLAMGALLVLRGELSAGAMIAASIMLGRALAPVEQVLSGWSMLQRALLGRGLLKTLMENEPIQANSTGLVRPVAQLSVQGITVLEPESNRAILRNLSFDLEPGQALGIIGPSSAGKSTLAQTLVGILPTATGQVRIGGATLAQYGTEELGQHIAYLPQSAVLFPGTIAENIARMDSDTEMKPVLRAALQANSDAMIKRLPLGYKTVLGAGGTPLSGGERQMIALTRALYGDPQIIVLDEPNTSLDREGLNALNTCIRRLKAENKAVVVMTHNPISISQCDQLALLENGRITTIGPRQEVLNAVTFNAQRGNMFNNRPIAV